MVHTTKKRGSYSRTGRFGVKKQKLTTLSKALILGVKTARTITNLRDAAESKLAKKKEGKREVRARIPYNRYHQILTIGEGNFSFTHALVNHFLAQHATEVARLADNKANGIEVAIEVAKADDDEPDEVRKPRESKSVREKAAAEKVAKKLARAEKYKKDGAFDPVLHQPYLSPHSPFTNPEVRVIATCYDSWRELNFKYGDDVVEHTAALALHNIPVYTGVDALHFEKALRGRRRVTTTMIEAARSDEAHRGAEHEEARRARRLADEAEHDGKARTYAPVDDEGHAEEEALAEAAAAAAEEDAASAFPDSDILRTSASALLFPPFITRRAFHS
jgi:hypothetical protein